MHVWEHWADGHIERHKFVRECTLFIKLIVQYCVLCLLWVIQTVEMWAQHHFNIYLHHTDLHSIQKHKSIQLNRNMTESLYIFYTTHCGHEQWLHSHVFIYIIQHILIFTIIWDYVSMIKYDMICNDDQKETWGKYLDICIHVGTYTYIYIYIQCAPWSLYI